MTSSKRHRGFRRSGTNSFSLSLAPSERDVLVNLAGQIVEILGERADSSVSDPLAQMIAITSHDSPPEDGVLMRLLPNAYADPVDASEFRRFTESDLRAKKAAHALTMRAQLLEMDEDELLIDADSALAWLGGLNDIRLSLGVRLEIDENSAQDLELLSPDNPMHAVFAVYSWLGWLQESLVLELMEGPAHGA